MRADRDPKRYFPHTHHRLSFSGGTMNLTLTDVVSGLNYLDDDANRLRVTALMGKWVESGILQQMTSSLKIDIGDDHIETYLDMQKRLSFLGEKTYTNTQLTELYYPIVRPVVAYDNAQGKGFIYCGAYDYGAPNQILMIADVVYKTKLAALYGSLGMGTFLNSNISEYFENAPDNLNEAQYKDLTRDVAMRRYIFESGLILFRQLVDPEKISFEDKLVIPDVKLGGIQLDGVLVDKDRAFGVGAWANRGAYVNMGDASYDVLEIKVKFSPRFTSGKDTLRKPLIADIRQFKGRLGQLILTWAERGSDFKLPNSVYFVYPRSVLPNRIHQVFIDQKFLNQWTEDLKQSVLLSDEIDPNTVRLLGLLKKLT